MLELESTYPEQEDLQLALNRCMSTIRDSLSDLELLFKTIIEGRTYIPDEDVAKLLHCGVKEIPQRLPRFRVNHVGGYLYKVADVYQFIESKRIGGK